MWRLRSMLEYFMHENSKGTLIEVSKESGKGAP
jgi:hypothetical protein